jgi:hypothetical protein
MDVCIEGEERGLPVSLLRQSSSTELRTVVGALDLGSDHAIARDPLAR